MTITVQSNQTWPVKTLVGQEIELRDPSEQRFYNEAQIRYMADNHFTVASDYRALDRLIFLETLMHRYQRFLAKGSDYDGILTPGAEEGIRKAIRETAPMISTVQTDLGLTKSQREKDQHESVGAYISKLQAAAKEHGIRREKQLSVALDLMNRLFSNVGSYRRASEAERDKLEMESAEDIVVWIEEQMRPEYEAVDSYFRKHKQRMWIGTL